LVAQEVAQPEIRSWLDAANLNPVLTAALTEVQQSILDCQREIICHA
jgi:phosphoenolpyruvate carboxylase